MAPPSDKEKPAVGWTAEDIMRAVNRAVYQALKRHKERGESIVIWRDGKVVTLTADEIELGPEDEDEFESGSSGT